MVQQFLDVICDPETQQAVILARPKLLKDVLMQALEFEVVKQSVEDLARVNAKELESLSIEDIVWKVPLRGRITAGPVRNLVTRGASVGLRRPGTSKQQGNPRMAVVRRTTLTVKNIAGEDYKHDFRTHIIKSKSFLKSCQHFTIFIFA